MRNAIASFNAAGNIDLPVSPVPWRRTALAALTLAPVLGAKTQRLMGPIATFDRTKSHKKPCSTGSTYQIQLDPVQHVVTLNESLIGP